MSAPPDHQIIGDILAGQHEALAALFDRHGPGLFEFIYLIVGSRDEAADLLAQVFERVPDAAKGLGFEESVRGWLYALAREMSFNFLRWQEDLDGLPPSNEPGPVGPAGDIWRAARRMPALYRAALALEELQGLSPTEKARALGIPRTDLPRLVEDARRSFESQYDLDALREGRPLAADLDPLQLSGLRRRTGSARSLFGFLPAIILPASLAEPVRDRIMGIRPAISPAEGETAILPLEEATPMAIRRFGTPPLEPQQFDALPFERAPLRRPLLPEGCSVPVILFALIIALLITAVAAAAAFALTRDRTAPTISQIDPPDNANLTQTHVIISASYQDDRAVDVGTVRLVVDGQDVTSQAIISDASLSYATDLTPGQHTLSLVVADTSGNLTSRTWTFTVQGPPATPTPTPTPTVAPTATATLAPTPTATWTPSAAPAINTFTADKTQITPGTSVLLSWSVANADVVFLNQEKVAVTGSKTVTPSSTMTYHLIVSGPGGSTEKAITVTVQQLPDLVVADITVNASGQIVYTIRNAGTGDVNRMFLVQVYVDGALVDSNYRVPSLPSGQAVSLPASNYTAVGSHTVLVRVNAPHDVQESNYDNDELTKTIIGPTPTPPPTATPTPTRAATMTPTPSPVVSSVSIAVTPITYSGACPAILNLTAALTTTGATSVTFKWERSTGYIGPAQTVDFTSGGSQTVSDQWVAPPAGAGWERIHIITPNDQTSDLANFTNHCH